MPVETTFVDILNWHQGKAKGGIYFHSISEVYVDHQKSQAASQRATFIMKTNDRFIQKLQKYNNNKIQKIPKDKY